MLGEVDGATVTRSFTPSLGREWGFPPVGFIESLTRQASNECLLCARRWGWVPRQPSPEAPASD